MNSLPKLIAETINDPELLVTLSKPFSEFNHGDLRLIDAASEYIGRMMIVLQRESLTNIPNSK